MLKKKLMFYCQHVLGMGHFIRSAEIVRGLDAFEVVFLNGGEIVPGFTLPSNVEVINLPPIKADPEFRDIHVGDGLRDEVGGGSANLDEIKEIRRQRILAEFDRVRPDVLVIELFPFGRLKFAFELIPLLERAKTAESRTKVAGSLRDILVSKREQRQFEEEACRIVNRYYDLLLVHSDPRFQCLDETFSRVSELKCPILYTGFVRQTESEEAPEAAADPPPVTSGEKTILVSLGGGRVGVELIDCVIEASALIRDKLSHRILIFTGPYLPASEFLRLQAKIAGNPRIILRRYTTRFISYMREADLSISMAGYNTCMNIVTTGVRAIVSPFIGNNNQEQTIRAEKLNALGIVEVIHSHELTPRQLSEKIFSALDRPGPRRDAPALDLDGVARTSAGLNQLVAAGSGEQAPEAKSWMT